MLHSSGTWLTLSMNARNARAVRLCGTLCEPYGHDGHAPPHAPPPGGTVLKRRRARAVAGRSRKLCAGIAAVQAVTELRSRRMLQEPDQRHHNAQPSQRVANAQPADDAIHRNAAVRPCTQHSKPSLLRAPDDSHAQFTARCRCAPDRRGVQDVAAAPDPDVLRLEQAVGAHVRLEPP